MARALVSIHKPPYHRSIHDLGARTRRAVQACLSLPAQNTVRWQGCAVPCMRLALAKGIEQVHHNT